MNELPLGLQVPYTCLPKITVTLVYSVLLMHFLLFFNTDLQY